MSKIVTLQERNKAVEAIGARQEPLLPASIDEAVDGKISYSGIENGMTVRFPFVDGMNKGSRYLLNFSSSDGRALALSGTIQEDNQDIVVSLSAEQARLFSGKLVLQYIYFDYPPDDLLSPSTCYWVEGWLYKPVVDEAVDGVIPISVVSQGVNLRIKSAMSLEENAVVSVYWIGSHSNACFVKYLIVQPGQSDEDIVIFVDREFLEPNKNGHVHFIYTVHSDRGTWTSRLMKLDVAGDLVMPTALYWAPEEVIYGSPATLLKIDESGKIPMRVPTLGMSQGDLTSFIFVGAELGREFVFRLPVTSADIAQGYQSFNLPIPFSVLAGNFVTFMAVVERQSGDTVGSPVNKLYVEED
ncbi:hypothetical protein [Pseudomonas sp. FSL W5-0299]|uniref:hypothetical protein n=1 Tax=Pseudomonas sp. FSL W5-0299 TaxID=1917484 RepID=UPI0009D33620|nr:hypothetical protein [Pseudomonas sp. FSL W5-0299]OOL37451.1 hypothetical protein BOO94_13610 [Pseudomonas sp. FSL W5-0299]